MRYVYYLIAAVLLTFSSESYAQSHDQQVRAQVDSVLTARYYKTPYDTNYVVRPEGSLTLKVRLNQSGDDIHAKGDKEGASSKADLKTDFKTTVSIGASYRESRLPWLSTRPK